MHVCMLLEMIQNGEKKFMIKKRRDAVNFFLYIH